MLPTTADSTCAMDEILLPVERYYRSRLLQHGATHAGVDWSSEDSQRTRFKQLLSVVDDLSVASVLDYGCGYGALLDEIQSSGERGDYVGYDISPAMVQAAQRRFEGVPRTLFTADEPSLKEMDFCVASGIFNVMAGATATAWGDYVLRTLDRLCEMSRRGFSFNMLTSYSDPDRKRPDLYYADPSWILNHVMRRYSRQAALLHNYGLFEFTITVHLGREGPFKPLGYA